MKLKKKLIPVLMASLVAIPGIAGAEEIEQPDLKPAREIFKETPGLKAKYRAGQKIHHHLMIGPHKEMYYELLAEKYTPEDLEEWQETIEERQSLMEEVKSLHLKEEGIEQRKELLEERKEALNELREKVQSGEITKDEAREIIKEWRQNRNDNIQDKKDEIRERFTPHIEEEKALREEFRNAVQAEDDEAIAAVLPKLLTHFQEENEKLQEFIEKMEENEPSSATYEL